MTWPRPRRFMLLPICDRAKHLTIPQSHGTIFLLLRLHVVVYKTQHGGRFFLSAQSSQFVHHSSVFANHVPSSALCPAAFLLAMHHSRGRSRSKQGMQYGQVEGSSVSSTRTLNGRSPLNSLANSSSTRSTTFPNTSTKSRSVRMVSASHSF